MASIFGHALFSVALGTSFSNKLRTVKFWLLGIVCAIIPDADVIGFNYGIKYASFWGHRGFTHSFVFAFLFGALITLLFYKNHFFSKKGMLFILFFFLCTASHSVLDAMTSGGKGVAFFSPFNDARYFFPFRPIKVSPLGIMKFFSQRGLKVIWSEFIWVGIPSIIYIISIHFLKIFRKNS